MNHKQLNEKSFERKLCDLSNGDFIIFNLDYLQEAWDWTTKRNSMSLCSRKYRIDCLDDNCTKDHKFDMIKRNHINNQYTCPFDDNCFYKDSCWRSHKYESSRFTNKTLAKVISSSHNIDMLSDLCYCTDYDNTSIRVENNNRILFPNKVRDMKNHNKICDIFEFSGIEIEINVPLEFKLENNIFSDKVILSIHKNFEKMISLEKYYVPFENKNDMIEVSIKCEKTNQKENIIRNVTRHVIGKVIRNDKDYYIVEISLKPIEEYNDIIVTPKLISGMRINEEKQTGTLYITKKIPDNLITKISKSKKDFFKRKIHNKWIQMEGVVGKVDNINYKTGEAEFQFSTTEIKNKCHLVYMKRNLKKELFYDAESSNTTLLNAFPENHSFKECSFCCESFNPSYKNKNNLISFCYKEMRVTGDNSLSETKTLKHPRHKHEICLDCLKKFSLTQFENGKNHIDCPFCMKERTISLRELARMRLLSKEKLVILKERSTMEINEKDTLDLLKMNKECKLCPNCLSPIEKNQGCNQMFCSFCGMNFDWRIGLNELTFVFQSVLPSI